MAWEARSGWKRLTRVVYACAPKRLNGLGHPVGMETFSLTQDNLWCMLANRPPGPVWDGNYLLVTTIIAPATAAKWPLAPVWDGNSFPLGRLPGWTSG